MPLLPIFKTGHCRTLTLTTVYTASKIHCHAQHDLMLPFRISLTHLSPLHRVIKKSSLSLEKFVPKQEVEKRQNNVYNEQKFGGLSNSDSDGDGDERHYGDKARTPLLQVRNSSKSRKGLSRIMVKILAPRS